MRSRQKSCVPCAKSKRRCEPISPQCPRCARRGIDCYYKNEPLRRARGKVNLAEEGSYPKPIDAEPIHEYDGIDPFLEEASASSFSPPVEIVSEAVALPPPLSLPVYPNFVTVDTWSIRQLVRSVRAWPEYFVRNLRAPFIHSQLYSSSLPSSLPTALHDAFSACAGYSTKTEENKDVVLALFERNKDSLLAEEPSMKSVKEHLAMLQAVLLLHIVQLFDGNIRQRALAEQHAPALEGLALSLHMRIMESDRSAMNWEQWMIEESARRTVLMTMLVQGMYEVNKYGVCTYVPTLADLPFTMGDVAWGAKTAADWQNVVQSRGARLITYDAYARAWRKFASNRPPDGFGKLLLTPCMGESFKNILVITETDEKGYGKE